MEEYTIIFEELENARLYAEKHNSDAVLNAAEHAEKIAVIELLDVDLVTPSDRYVTLADVILPKQWNRI